MDLGKHSSGRHKVVRVIKKKRFMYFKGRVAEREEREKETGLHLLNHYSRVVEGRAVQD